MARDDESSLPRWLALPGGKDIGLGRHWHGLVSVLWVLNGAMYVGLLFLTGEWRRIVPTSWEVFPQAWDSLQIYAGLGVPSIENFTPYDSLQQLLYFTVVFIVAPLMMATGPVMSPAVIGQYPWYPKIFGGRQAARSIHFLGMAFLTVFIVMHVALVFIVHRGHNTTHMVFGAYDPARVAQGTTFLVLGAVLVVAAWIAISYLSVIDARATQRFLFRLLEPIRAVTVNKMKSRTREAGTYTEADISPYHWSNGRHPTPEESPEWHALAAHDFRDYVLEIGPSDHPPARHLRPDQGAAPARADLDAHLHAGVDRHRQVEGSEGDDPHGAGWRAAGRHQVPPGHLVRDGAEDARWQAAGAVLLLHPAGGLSGGRVHVRVVDE